MKTKFLTIALAISALSMQLLAQNVKQGLSEYKLDNGLTVYLWEDHNQPNVSGRVVVRAGAIDEPVDYTGLAHYLEHMIFKGTSQIGALDWEKEEPLYNDIIALYDQLNAETDEKVRLELIKKINEKSLEAAQYSATDDYSNLIEGIGGENLNAFTGYDLTAYVSDFPTYQMEKWLKIYSDELSDTKFRSFQAELENVFEEYNMYQDYNSTHISEFLFGNLYKGHPYERDVIGSPEHLKNPSLSQLIKFYETWYVPNNMALILVGNFDTEEAKPLIEKYFGRLKAKELPERPKYNVDDFAGNPKKSAKIGYYPTIVWAYNGVKCGDPDELLINFTLAMLNNNHSTGLFDKQMLDGNITMLAAENDSRRDLGRIIIDAIPYFDIAQNTYETNSATEKIMQTELDKLRNGTFEDWLFESVKKQMLQAYELQFESSSSKMSIITNAFTYQQELEDALTENERIAAITRDDVKRTAQKYLTGNHMTLTIDEGTPKKNKLKKPEIKPLDPPKGVETAYSKAYKEMPTGETKETYNNFDDVTVTKLYDGITLHTAENPANDVFSLTLRYGIGTEKMPLLEYATALMNTAGANQMDAQTLHRKMSELGGTCSFSVSGSYFYVSLYGEEKNLAELCRLMTQQVLFPKLDQKQLESVISNELSSRYVEKKNSDIMTAALMEYVLYKEKSKYIDRIDVEDMYNISVTEDGEVNVNYKITIPQLTQMITDARSYELDIHYVGKTPANEAAEILKANLPLVDGVKASESPITRERTTYDAQTIFFLPNANMQQAKIYFYIDGKPYDIAEDVDYDAFEQYFSGGFSGLVMNEIREKRSMAYTAYGYNAVPERQGKKTFFIGYVGTQGDKVADAVEVYMDLLTNMPLYPERIDNIKTYLRQSSLTNKPSFRRKSQVFDSWQKLGYADDPARVNMPKIEGLDFDQIEAFYNANIKGKPITIVITGDPKTIDLKRISKSFGKVTKLNSGRLFKGGF